MKKMIHFTISKKEIFKSYKLQRYNTNLHRYQNIKYDVTKLNTTCNLKSYSPASECIPKEQKLLTMGFIVTMNVIRLTGLIWQKC